MDLEITVFAPTDDAFGVALNELGLTADDLLASDGLADILTHHVVGSVAMSSDLSDGMIIESLLGDDLLIGINGVVSINNAVVITADVNAVNGVVHVVDSVIENSTSQIVNIESAQESYYLFSVDISGKIIDIQNRFRETNQIVFDVYSSGKVIKRVTIQ